ncbi:putative ubiquitin-protein ligase synoviolin precursor [Cladorrhinum samala]|uniref:RING-type E3 ubiquitin transferase n=1 Tax=Cladorrhinum samala TaxID=585594 RepID=A0AAV9I7R7_9PEZI|nr:putative ubiquitin-protein ligase synoviolin precursor [Cladorrhinum samala]
MKMRYTWYAGASIGLAATVVASAFYQRANFYSAMVHLAQSNLSLMVLANLVFVVYGSFMYGLQRLCFGPLRPTEIEQLYEKGWFAVTETCLAMTIFRDEIGAFFLVMFTALITGKVWGWIGEGRIEVLEQQPPANPRLFHTRLSISLLASVVYDIWLLRYAVNTVVQQARPTMMVMFLFEFAILLVCSLHTSSRYVISLVEQQVVKTQTRQRLEERRRQVREQRLEIERRRQAEGASEDDNEELPNEDDIEEMDIEVSGWENKGQWVLSLDLVADFIKLGIYTAFFGVIFAFYNLPIHIFRDWFMTTRSFLKRLHALIRYRQALKHMDQYPDATVEDLGREDTCIICREEMRPWNPADAGQIERTRAKKLPCGHILHFGCLKSWLERQQVCPTCRRPVNQDGQQRRARDGEAMVFRLGLNLPVGQNRLPQAQPQANGQAQVPAAQPPQGAPGADDQANNQNRNVRMFNLGPLRLGFAQGGVEDIREMAQRLGLPADVANHPAPTPTVPAQIGTTGNSQPNLDQIRNQVAEIARRVQQEVVTVNQTAHEVQIWQNTVQVLQNAVNEIARVRQANQQQSAQQQTAQAAPLTVPLPQAAAATSPGSAPVPSANVQTPQPQQAHPAFQQHFQHYPGFQQHVWVQHNPWYQQQLLQQQHTWHQQQAHHGQQPQAPQAPAAVVPRTLHTINRRGGPISYQAGDPGTPEGLILPAGWTLIPLSRAGEDQGEMPNEHLESEAPRDPQVPEADESRLAEHAQAPANDLRDRLQALVPQGQENSRSRSASPSAPSVNPTALSQAANQGEAPNRPLSPAVGWDWREIDGAALETPPDEPESSQADATTIAAAAAGVEHASHNITSASRAATVEEADDNENL